MNHKQYKYIDGRRYYQIENIGLVPGVTSVLSATRLDKDKAALSKWREEVGEKSAERILKASQKRGTAVHTAIQQQLENKSIEISEEYFSLFKTLEPFMSKVEDLQYIEKFICHPSGFAGTPDLIAVYEQKLTLIDWKTSGKPKSREWIKDYILQVAAYVGAANYIYKLNIEQGLIAIAVEDPLQCQIFHIDKEELKQGWQEFQNRLKQFQTKFGKANSNGEIIYQSEDLI